MLSASRRSVQQLRSWRRMCLAAGVIALLVLLVCARPARSSGPTTVSGTISTNTTWTTANSPYVLSGTVDVASGVTLTIDPGVVVEGSSTSVLSVHGALSAVGTTSSRITFTSSASTRAAGDWGNIQFQASSGTSTLQYVDVKYGGAGGVNYTSAMVVVWGGTVSLLDSTFSKSGDSGLYATSNSSGTDGVLTIRRSKFDQNGLGSVAGDGVLLAGSNATIRDSAIWRNGRVGLDVDVVGYSGPEVTMAGTSVWNNVRGVEISDTYHTSSAIEANVSGELPNEVYDNGTFGWSSSETWNQLDVSNPSPLLDWSNVYWGPVVYQACSGTGHLSYGVQSELTGAFGLKFERGPSTKAPDFWGSAYCANDDVKVNAPLVYQPDLYFDPPPPLFGGMIPQAFWNCKECVRNLPGIAHALDAGPNPAHNVGDPVNTATGDFLENAVDLKLAGPGIPFLWTRSYNSADTGTSGLGVGWTDAFEARLTSISSTGDVTYEAGSGQQTVFKNFTASSGAADYVAKGFDGAFSRMSSGSFVMTMRDQRVFTFDSTGHLTSIQPRFLPATTLNYTSGKLTSITDSAGRTITLTYSTTTPSLITQVTLPDSRSVQYGYTGNLLTSVTDARGKTSTLTYDGNNRLTSIKDATNTYQIQAISYDGAGRVTSEENGAGDATSYAYSNNGVYDVTTVTLPGHTGSWVYEQLGNMVFFVTDPLSRTTSYTYDAMGHVATVTDARGNTTRYEYDRYGNITKTVAPSPLNYTTTATYNATNDPLTQTDGRGNTTSYAYATSSDAPSDYQVGQLKTVTDRESGVTTLKYYTASSSPTPPTSNRGLLKSSTDQRSKTTTFGYDSDGNLSSSTSPLGNKTTMVYDGSGRMTSRRDPRGNAVTPAAGYLTQWTYDSLDHVSTTTDANSNVTTYHYTDSELPLDVVRTDRGSTTRTTSFAYNSNNQLYTTTDPRSGVEYRLYWPDGSLKQVTSPAGRITKYTYDDAGQLYTLVEPNGNVSGATPSDYTFTYGYDDSGNQTSVAHPDGGTTSVSYDALNRPTQWTDANSHSTSVSYDANGNITQRTDPLSHSQSFTYDKENRQLTATNELSKTTTNTYFATGQLASVTTPLGNETTYTLDNDGRVATMVEPRGNVSGGTPANYTWTYGYDEAGNRMTVTDPLSNQTTYSYDAVNDLTQVTDANSHSTSFSYDVLNRLWKVTPPAAGNTGTLDTVYVYDADGNLASRTDPNSNTTSWSYDLDGRPTQRVTPVGTWNYTYDANGNLKTTETPAGSSTGTAGDGTISDSYDRMSRLTGVSYSDTTSSVSRSYDNAGRLTGMTDGSGSVAYSYDNADRLTDVTRSSGGSGLNGTFHYGYDNAGQITGRTYPDSTTTSATFDDDGRLATVATGGNTTTLGYDAAGNLTSLALPSGNGYVENRSYDRAGRLTTVDNTKSSTSLSKFTWTLDPVGNPTKTDTLRGGTDVYDGYEYDARNRLTAACYGISSGASNCSGASNELAYSYDKVDNITQQVRTGSVGNTGTNSYAYNSADQLTSTTRSGTTTNYSYDTNGNETSDGTNSFTYNIADQLISSTTSSVTTTYSYDGDGNRLTSQTTGGADLNYTWDNQAPDGLREITLERTSAGSLVRRYLDGPLGAVSLTNASSTFYYHQDPLGSVSDLTDSTGAAQWAYSYEPYGAPRTTTNVSGSGPENRLRFDAQYFDGQIGMYDLRAREYDGVGRFVSLDPLFDRTAAAYEYADGNPLANADPTGMAIPLDYGDPGNIDAIGGGSNGAHAGRPVWGGGQLNGFPSLQAAWDRGASGLETAFGDLSGPSPFEYWSNLCQIALLPIGFDLGVAGEIGAEVIAEEVVGEAAAKAAPEINEGIYVIRGARGTYVGQSGNITQRFSQHLIENGGRFTQKELDAAERFGVPGGKTAREIAEQQKIDEFPNGIDDLLNKRNPIGPRRIHLMPKGYSRP